MAHSGGGGALSISRPGACEVYRLGSNMPKSQKSRKPLQADFLSLLLNNQKEILKRGMTWIKQKPKGTTFKVPSIAKENPLYIDFLETLCPFSLILFANCANGIVDFCFHVHFQSWMQANCIHTNLKINFQKVGIKYLNLMSKLGQYNGWSSRSEIMWNICSGYYVCIYPTSPPLHCAR